MTSSMQTATLLAAPMNKFWRWLIALFVAVAAPKTWAAAAATAATAGMAAAAAGIDPLPWVIGGFGAAIVFVKQPSTSKGDAIINALISVMIGGLIAPWAAAWVGEYLSPKLANSYALAFVLSGAWPWLAPIAFSKMKAVKIPGQTEEN